MNPEIGNQAETTRWGLPVQKELLAKLLGHLRERGTPQTSRDVANALKKHVLEVEEHLDFLAAAKFVRYTPFVGGWGWIAVATLRAP